MNNLIKIAVIITDARGQIHAGLDVEKFVKVFELSEDISKYIINNNKEYISVSFALVEEDK